MEHEKSIAYPENKPIPSKVFNAQSVIINKYKKARMDRLEREQEAARSIKPIIVDSNAVASTSRLSTDSAFKQINFSLPPSSKQSLSVRPNEKTVNALCKRLQLLLSTPFADSDNRTSEMNSILNELRALEIIV